MKKRCYIDLQKVDGFFRIFLVPGKHRVEYRDIVLCSKFYLKQEDIFCSYIRFAKYDLFLY